MNKEYFKKNHIKANIKADSPEEAIRAVGELMEANGLIRASYTDGMVESFKEHGPYIVIAPGLAMPHARPEAGVIEIGACVAALAEPVVFGHSDNDPVKLVIGLSAKDSESHIGLLQELMEVLADEKKRDKLINSNDEEVIYDLLNI